CADAGGRRARVRPVVVARGLRDHESRFPGIVDQYAAPPAGSRRSRSSRNTRRKTYVGFDLFRVLRELRVLRARPEAQWKRHGTSRSQSATQAIAGNDVLTLEAASGCLISSRNSIRVRASSWKTPSIALVTATEFCFSTPRIDMQRCAASITTATPSGCTLALSVSAI